MDLVLLVYQTSESFPRHETFGLTSQLRRAVVSVPANIAEGQARLHRREFLHHLSIARGSLAEAETLVHIAVRLGYISEEVLPTLMHQVKEVARMLAGLIRSIDHGPTTLHGR